MEIGPGKLSARKSCSTRGHTSQKRSHPCHNCRLRGPGLAQREPRSLEVGINNSQSLHTQALLSLELGDAFPELPFLAEEDAAGLLEGGATLLAQVSALVAEYSSSSRPPSEAEANCTAHPLAHAHACFAKDNRFLSFRQVHNAQVLQALDRGRFQGGDGMHWVLDPIDGTRGFLAGGAPTRAF